MFPVFFRILPDKNDDLYADRHAQSSRGTAWCPEICGGGFGRCKPKGVSRQHRGALREPPQRRLFGQEGQVRGHGKLQTIPWRYRGGGVRDRATTVCLCLFWAFILGCWREATVTSHQTININTPYYFEVLCSCAVLHILTYERSSRRTGSCCQRARYTYKHNR